MKTIVLHGVPWRDDDSGILSPVGGDCATIEIVEDWATFAFKLPAKPCLRDAAGECLEVFLICPWFPFYLHPT